MQRFEETTSLSVWVGQVFLGPVSLSVSLAIYSFLSLLRARPVMSVSAQLSFSPNEISLNDFECPGDKAFNAFNLTSCFTVTERTSSSGNVTSQSLSHMKSMASICLTPLISLRISREEPEYFSEPECWYDERNQSRILRSDYYVVQDSAEVRPAGFWDLLFQLPSLHAGTFHLSRLQPITAASV